MAANIAVLITSPELILTRKMVRMPPAVPKLVWLLNEYSGIRYFFSILTAAWLTVPITPPARAIYPAIFIIIAGNNTGAATKEAPVAANIIPVLRTFLKKTGVGFSILLIIVFMIIVFSS